MRILFMGTPDIAAESLAALLDAGHEVCGVFTRRDKPVGRKQILTAPPVKQLAVEHGLSVYQPRTLRDGSSDELIKELAPDIIVVVAYGCIIPPQLLHVAKYGCINLHVSLLPKYRGSAPIQWAVLNGDEGTGVTIMQLDEGLDTGDILMVEPVTIDPEETSGELFDRVSAVGAGTLVTALEKIEAGELTPRKQDNAAATMAPPLTKDMAQFDFTQDAAHIHNWVRGMNPWPVAWFAQDGKRIKVLESRLAENPQHAAPGTVLALKPLTIAAENGAVAQRADLEQLDGLGLNALGGVNDHDGGVRRHQGAVGVLTEVLVAGRVQNVDTLVLIVELQNRRGNGNTALLFNVHPVGHRMLGALLALDRTCGLDGPTVEQELFGECGFTGVGVRDDRKCAPGFDFFAQ